MDGKVRAVLAGTFAGTLHQLSIMANKALAKRQKLAFRVEPSQKSMKPRNPVAIAAKQRAAGPHKKTASAQRQVQQRSLKKLLTEPDKH